MPWPSHVVVAISSSITTRKILASFLSGLFLSRRPRLTDLKSDAINFKDIAEQLNALNLPYTPSLYLFDCARSGCSIDYDGEGLSLTGVRKACANLALPTCWNVWRVRSILSDWRLTASMSTFWQTMELIDAYDKKYSRCNHWCIFFHWWYGFIRRRHWSVCHQEVEDFIGWHGLWVGDAILKPILNGWFCSCWCWRTLRPNMTAVTDAYRDLET